MVNPLAALGAENTVNPTNMVDSNQKVDLSQIGNPSDIVANVSNDYDFMKAIMQNKYAVDEVNKTLTTQKAVAEFSYQTELVGKVASIATSDINSLVKMQ